MSVIRRPLTFLAAAAAALALAGCSTTVPDAGGTEPAGNASSETRTVSTDLGEVTVPAEAERIVVLNSNLAGYLFALDTPVHATIPEVPGPGGGEYPEIWAKDAKQDGTIILPWGEDGFDFEAILAEKPDLIIGGGQGFPAFQAAEAYDQLSDIAPTVIVSKELLTWQGQLDFIAEDVLGDAAGGKKLADAYDARVAEVADAITLPPLPVAYLVMTADGVPFSLPEDSALPQTLAELGFEPAPVIADNPDFTAFGTGDSFELSTEQVTEVFTAPSLFAFGFNNTPVSLAELTKNPVYAALPAVTAGNAFDLPNSSYRADYLRTMELLDWVEATFA